MSEAEVAVIDVRDLVGELCARAGVAYHRTSRIVVEPATLTIVFSEFEGDEQDRPHLDPSTGEVASREVTFRIRT